MLTRIIIPLVANGTTAFMSGYEPWLPFYNFFPVIIAAGVVISVLTRTVFWGVNFTVSSIFSLIPTWGLWRVLDLEPTAIFIVWTVNMAFLVWFQCFMIYQRKMSLRTLKSEQEHSHRVGGDFETYEEYLEHIKTAHPDIWKKCYEETEK